MPIDNEVTVIEARDLINEKKKLNLVDLRTPEEFSEFALEGFQNIPLDELTAHLPDFDQRRLILLICDDSKLSRKAQKITKACSLRSYIIRGGLKEWKQVINPKIKRNFPDEILHSDAKR